MRQIPPPEQAVDELCELLLVLAHQALLAGHSEKDVLEVVTRLTRMACKTVRERQGL